MSELRSNGSLNHHDQKKKRGGRPAKLTEDIQETIITYIRAGNYIETAAAAAGISKSTLYFWLKKGRQAKSGKYRVFSDSVQKAIAEAEVRDISIIGKAAEKSWQAAAWRQERKNPERWGRKDVLGIQELPEEEERRDQRKVLSKLTVDDLTYLSELQEKIDE